MFSHAFGAATLGKPLIAFGIIASAYGAAGTVDQAEYRMTTPPVRETARPQTTVSFEALLSECVARYARGATNTKEACDRAIVASGLTADAFAATYRSLLVPPALRTEKPASTSTPRTTKTQAPTTTTTVSFEALLSECVARYKRGAANTKEACERAIAASGLSTEAFMAKYRSLLVPSVKTESTKPTTTPRPTTAPKLDMSDPKLRECLAKYEVLKGLKTSGAQTFDAALKYFNETCGSVFGARG